MKRILLLFTLSIFVCSSFAQLRDIDKILPERDRATKVNQWLEWRLDNIIPELLQREQIDTWIVMCRETNEDPVFWSMLPEPLMHARRLTVLIFHNYGDERGVVRLSGGGSLAGGFIGTWKDRSKSQWESLADLIKELDPKKIGINVSETHRSADGLSASLHQQLVSHLAPKYRDRLVSAEKLSIGWLETRSEDELAFYRHLCGIAHDLIHEFYSNGVITPGITTCQDVVWWIRNRITLLGLETWFQPTINVQRHPDLQEKYKDEPDIIRHGDLIHCDVGIHYMRLCTDMQWHAYVCHPWETDAPDGLKQALANAVRVADIFMGEFKEGATGHTIAKNTHAKAESEGLDLMLYTHPIGYYGHCAGTSIDTRPSTSLPNGMYEIMEYPLHLNTVYAIEFGCYTEVPEWNNQRVTISYEEQGVMTEKGCHWVDGNQNQLILLR